MGAGWFNPRPMANRRIQLHRLQEFVRLHRLGTGAREVARLLQMSPNTERRYRLALEAAGLLQGPASPLPPLDEPKAAVQAQRPPPAQAAHETSSIEALRDQGRGQRDGLGRAQARESNDLFGLD